MTALNLTVNGDRRRYPTPLSVTALLEDLGMADKRVAVEVNHEIVPRSRHRDYLLEDQDQVEVVQAIGGG